MNGAVRDSNNYGGNIKFNAKNGLIDVTNSLKRVFKTKDTQWNHGYKISLVDINGNGTNFAWAGSPN